MSAFVDALAFHLMAAVCRAHAALTERASRHLCAKGCHDPEIAGRKQYSRYDLELVACTRPGCTFSEQHVVKKQRARG